MQHHPEFDYDEITDGYESDEYDYETTAERILALSDALSEEIIFDNIEEQLSGKLDDQMERVNYVALFREKYEAAKKDDYLYDKEYVESVIDELGEMINDGMEDKYLIGLGSSSIYDDSTEYIEDLEALYEFVYIRHFQNLVDYFKWKIAKNKEEYVLRYEDRLKNDIHEKDIFATQNRKRFADHGDLVILTYMNEIIDDICDESTSCYVLLSEISAIDKFEETNNRIIDMIADYGNRLHIKDDAEAAKRYMYPAKSSEYRGTIRSSVWSDYIERCQLAEMQK